jgi:hypothetical protein
VSAHLLLPEHLADDLPPVDRSFGDFKQFGNADDADDDPGATARGFAAVAAFGTRIEELKQFAAASRALHGTPISRFSTFLFPHQP